MNNKNSIKKNLKKMRIKDNLKETSPFLNKAAFKIIKPKNLNKSSKKFITKLAFISKPKISHKNNFKRNNKKSSLIKSNKKPSYNNLNSKLKFSKKPNLTKRLHTKKIVKFKLKKKWRFWRLFKRFFLHKTKITRFNKLKWRYNNIRILWHQYANLYFKELKHLFFKKSKKGFSTNFSLLLTQLELRLYILILRTRFVYNSSNSKFAIKKGFILVNGLLITNPNFLLNISDLFQKRKIIRATRRNYSYKKRFIIKRTIRFKWRKQWWRHSRFLLWKIRRNSHFNMYHSKKIITLLNYLEINYKIPACIIIKKPLLKELFINKNELTLTNKVLKKIYFLY